MDETYLLLQMIIIYIIWIGQKLAWLDKSKKTNCKNI